MRGVRELAKRSNWVVIAVTIAKDQRTRLAARLGTPRVRSGATHPDLSLDESLAYIDDVFEDYLHYGGLTRADLKGSRALELGPGDSYGVAPRFLGAGAERVACVDKFATARDQAQQRRIYDALQLRLDDESR